MMDTLKGMHKAARWAYHKLQDRTPLLPEKCHEKWQTELNLDDQFMWKPVYERIHSRTSDVKLKWFEYRCIKRILTTNRLLYIYGLSESDKCKNCPIYSETLAHKFWHCSNVRTLWNQVGP